MNTEPISLWKVLGGIGTSFVALLLVIGLLVGAVAGCKAFNRSQAIKDTKNRVHVAQLRAKNSIILTEIELRRYKQQKKIERAKAQVRFIHSVGIRRAQDEIARTLTPLYVQFEMTQALQQIALSGKNNTIIYLPTDPKSGLPVVPTSNTPSQK